MKKPTPSQHKPKTMMDGYLTRPQAARELRMSITKLDREIKAGKLRAKRHGHTVFVTRSQIARYLEEMPDASERPPAEPPTPPVGSPLRDMVCWLRALADEIEALTERKD